MRNGLLDVEGFDENQRVGSQAKEVDFELIFLVLEDKVFAVGRDLNWGAVELYLVTEVHLIEEDSLVRHDVVDVPIHVHRYDEFRPGNFLLPSIDKLVA